MTKCYLCQSSEVDDVRFGELLTKKKISVHTFCLYLTSNLAQRGEDHEGLIGFLLEDIKSENRRVSRVKCCYCGKPYANIGCCESRCHNSFHLICGLKHGAQNQFVGTYRSYCDRHVRRYTPRPAKTEFCCVCYDNFLGPEHRFSSVNILQAPCCRNGWFHKICLQGFASSSGYFFKCPLCNDSKTFRGKLPYRGIFIPDRDAAWELEPGAFAELLERPNTCSADVCKNELGRQDNNELNPLLLCSICGSVAIHKMCSSHKSNCFECNECKQLLGNDSGRRSFQNIVNDEEEDLDVDVCTENELSAPSINEKNGVRGEIVDENCEKDDEVIASSRLYRLRNQQSSSRALLENLNAKQSLQNPEECLQLETEDESSTDSFLFSEHRDRMRKLLGRKRKIIDDSDDSSSCVSNSSICKPTESNDNITSPLGHCEDHAMGIEVSNNKKESDNVFVDSDDDDPLDDIVAYIEKKHQKSILSERIEGMITEVENCFETGSIFLY